MIHKTHLAALLLACATLLCAAEPSDTTDQPESNEVAENYLAWQKENATIPEDTAPKLDEIQTRASQRGGDRDLIVRCLSVLHPEFRRALRNLNNEQPALAIELLQPMLKSDNPYLAANARFFIARARMQQEDHEAAAEHLSALGEQSPPRTQYRGESLFRLAICQTRLLERRKALTSITRFLREHPDAPEWQQSRAQQLALELMTYREGGLREVSDLMQYSRRRLKLAELDAPTRPRQKRIVEVLDKIIEKAQKQQGQGSGQGQGMAAGTGSGPPQGNAPPSAPATESRLSGGTSSMGERGRTIRGRPGENWGQMPPREREKALSHIKSKFPERYRELVEQYYKSLQEEE